MVRNFLDGQYKAHRKWLVISVVALLRWKDVAVDGICPMAKFIAILTRNDRKIASQCYAVHCTATLAV